LFRKTASGILLFLLLASTLTLAFNIQPVKADGGTIYIRADGSIDPETSSTPPEANFIAFPEIFYVGENVTLDASASRDGWDSLPDPGHACPITSYLWEIDLFDDGTIDFILEGVTNSFTCTEPGMVAITLTVTAPDPIPPTAPDYIPTDSYKRVIMQIIPPVPGIEIWPDGSVWPSDAPISSVDNITYTLIGDIYGGTYGYYIYVAKDNITIDGAGYTVGGIWAGNNVTIKNTNIKGFYYYGSFSGGIQLEGSNNSIIGNTFVNAGLFVSLSSSGKKVVNNFVNGKPLVYLEGVSDYTIQDAGQVILVECNNIEVKNLDLSNATIGVDLWETSNTRVIGNSIANNRYGIRLYSSSNNTIHGNNIANNAFGVALYSSLNNSISRNKIENSVYDGILFGECSSNSIVENNIATNGYGVDLYLSSNNIIVGNNIEANTWHGIYLSESLNNIIVGNNITTNNWIGIYCSGSSNNRLRNNKLSNNLYNFFIEVWQFSDFIQDIDASNTVDGKPIYYWIDKRDMIVPADAGYVALINCTRITVQNLNLTNNGEGVLLASTTNSTITKNNIANNQYGIRLNYHSSNNTVSGNNVTANNLGILLYDSSDNNISANNITANNGDGILLWEFSNNNSIVGNTIENSMVGIYLQLGSNNSIYHNNFINNNHQVSLGAYPARMNFWDDGYPSGGNYWSDYADVDSYSGPYQNETGSDGIWDHPYVIDANNQDRYPLVNPWTPTLPNQPPVAGEFSYYPINPKAGEQVIFDASSSYDPDGEIMFYEWDWNGDGYYDEYTTSPVVTFWWAEKGSYNVTLSVTDNEGATNTAKQEITIRESAESKIILCGWGWNPLWTTVHWEDHCKFKSIDEWLRDNANSKKLSWLPPKFSKLEEPDIVDILNTEIDHDLAPGLTYMDYAINAICEAKLVDEAWRQPTAKLNIMMKPLVQYAFGSIWGLLVSEQQIIELAAKVSIEAGLTLAIGLPTMLMAKKILDIKNLVDLAMKEGYTLGLGRYFFNRWLYGDHETAWNDPDVQNAVCLSIKADATEEEKNRILQETSWYFDNLWMKYKADDYYDPGVVHATGFPQDLRNQIKTDLRNLLVSALEKNSYRLKNSVIIHVASPVELCVSDSQGRITGVLHGGIREEIPYSVYDDETKTIRIFNTTDSHYYTIVGTSAGTYKLEIIYIGNGQIINFTAADIPTSIEVTHQYTIDWNALSRGEEGVTVQVDSEGDGVFEHTFTSDGELTRSEFLVQTAPPPVGGYSFSIQVHTKAEPIMPYIALIATLTVIFTKLRPKTKRKHRQ